jgi:hypothetical protein
MLGLAKICIKYLDKIVFIGHFQLKAMGLRETEHYGLNLKNIIQDKMKNFQFIINID